MVSVVLAVMPDVVRGEIEVFFRMRLYRLLSSSVTSVARFGATLVVCMTVCVTACRAPKLNGTLFDPPEQAPALVLPRADGSVYDLRAQKGHVVLLFFGYTHCPDVCPTTLADWQKVQRALGADNHRVEFVFVSVDPGRDTPASAQAYVNNFSPSFIGLSGDSAQTAQLLNQFHITASRSAPAPGADGYAVVHSSQTFVIDPQGRLRMLYQFGFPTDLVVSDVRQLVKI